MSIKLKLVEDFPKDWDQVNLVDLVKINPIYKLKEGEEYDFLPMERVAEGFRGVKNFEKRLFKKQGGSKFRNQDIVFAKITPCTENGKTAYINNLSDDYGFGSTEFLVFSPNRKQVYPDYLYRILTSHRIYSSAVSRMEGTTGRQRVPKDAFKNILVGLPSIEKQKKIAEILSTIDEAIENSDAIIKETQQLKKGLMQKLFTEGIGHTRFKETKIGMVPEEWNVVKLGEIGASRKHAIVDGPFGSSINTSKDYIKIGVPVIRTVNIRPFRFIPNNLKFMSEALFKKLKRSAVYPGDILLSKVGTIGHSCLFPEVFEKAILSTTGSCKITVNTRVIDNLFLCYQLNYIKPYLDMIASEGVQPFLNMRDIKNLNLFLPSLKEQKQLVGILSEVDSKIENEQNTKAELEQLKRGLMQVLLTGKIRVRV